MRSLILILFALPLCAAAQRADDLGHSVRLMAPQFVKPYVKTNKNDVADAEAICEAVSRPNMRFVPIKSIEQQAILSVHRVRQGFVKARTAQANQIPWIAGRVWVDHSAGHQPYHRARAGPARRCEQ